jgi:hypothetical protein
MDEFKASVLILVLTFFVGAGVGIAVYRTVSNFIK